MDESEINICSDCVRDSFLSLEMASSGENLACTCCEEEGKCWPLDALAMRVKEVFDKHYDLTPSRPDSWEEALMRDKESHYFWAREGESPFAIVESLTGLPPQICSDLVNSWPRGTRRSYKEPDYEDPYDSDACYLSTDLSHAAIEERWGNIQQELFHRSRFFNHATHEFLVGLFDGVQELRGGGGLVVETYNPESFDGIFRARVAYDESGVKKILMGLPNELGVLRGRNVSAGRMNAAGVTVMYGALDESTCIAEVRAPVGSHVVIGKFKLLRPIRVLNLKLLERSYEDNSLFDPDFQKKSDRIAFLRSLSQRLSVPVFSHAAQFDYLATQSIAEYIASLKPSIDGVAFASAQAGGDAMNLVLFDDACHIAPLPYPAHTKVELQNRIEDEDDPEGDRWLVFTLPADEKNISAVQQTSVASEIIEESMSSFQLPIKPSLVLDLAFTRVHRITSVVYNSDPSKVYVAEHHAQEKDISKDLEF